MNSRLTIFVCTSHGDEEWRWLAPYFEGEEMDWSFHVRKPRGFWQRHLRMPGLALRDVCKKCVEKATENPNAVLITLDPRATFWCSRFLARRAGKALVPHIAYGFHFAKLPQRWKRKWMAKAFSTVKRFIVSSDCERKLYSDHFAIPIGKFEMKHWGMTRPECAEPAADLPNHFICSPGGHCRDYPTLMHAMRLLPDVHCVAIMPLRNLRRLDVPPNVTVLGEMPFPQAMSVLDRSRFVVFALTDGETPCDPLTIVATMHRSKAAIVTRSVGIADYIQDEQTGLTCEPGNARRLADKIRWLWSDPNRTALLGRRAQSFAEKHCSEQSVADHFRGLLVRYGFLHRLKAVSV